MESGKEFAFSQSDFEYLRDIVTRTSGILAPDDKYTMYYSRLARRLRSLGLKDFGEYRQYLESNQQSESIELVNSVTTNLTAFFREDHHFEFIRDVIVPARLRSQNTHLRIWSAGCSTGEESYSIAMTLMDAIPNISQWDVKILATDIDSNVLKTGESGVYDLCRVENLDKSLLKRHFKKGRDKNTGKVRVNHNLRELIKFRQLNLLERWPLNEKMDFIFCRNVVIYFDQSTKSKLVDRFGDQLVDDGHLFMGHSESLHQANDRFQLLGKTVYQVNNS